MASFDMTFLEKQSEFNAEFGQTQKVSTSDYVDLFNKPSIEGVTLVGDKTFTQLGLSSLTPQDIDEIIYGGN